jgi:hypothetical protein
MIVGIMGFTGLAVDVGYLQYEKRRIQAAADAAAMGALREMERGNTDTVAAGQNDAALNGFSDGVNNTTVTVGTPTSGTYANNTSAIQAIVTRNVPTFFMQVFGQRSVNITGTAVAKTSSAQGSIGGCIFVLNPTASKALWVHGNLTMETACSVVVNSNSSSAFVANGNASMLMDNNALVGVVGPGTSGQGWSFTGGAQVTNNKTSTSESPTNIQSFTDPFALVAAPTASGVTVQVASGGQKVDKNHGPTTLSPGVYCGGIDVQSTNGPLTLNSGTYILAGGGLNITAGANVVSAPGGVMFYNTTSNSDSWGCTGSSGAGPFTITGGGTVNLSALTSTDTTFPGASGAVGMIFFDDRNVTGLAHSIKGNAGDTFDGALYFKNASLYFTGTSSTNGYLVLVSDTLEIGGNAGLKNDYTTLANVYTIAPGSTGGGLVQ